MQCLEIENQVQLTHVLEKPIERLDEYLDEIEERERGFGGCGDHDEVKGGIVPVGDQRGSVVVGLGCGCGF